MKAVAYQHCLPIQELKSLLDIELPTPQPAGRDLLVKVAAVSVNPVDTKVRKNRQPDLAHPGILGWDAVAEVVATGDEVSAYRVGDKVWYAGDLTRPGSNAEYQLVDERIVGHKPKSLSNAEAAAIPLTAITAWELLFDCLEFKNHPSQTKDPECRLLIVGAAGGVGSILTQLAAQLTSATIIATASRPESQQWVKTLGADHVIDHSRPLREELEKAGIGEITHVISLTHTEQHFAELVEVMAPRGKLALIDDPENGLDIMLLKPKSISLHWEMMFTRSMYQTADMDKQRELLNRVSSMFDQGILKSTLGEHYGSINATSLRRAHAHIESGKAIGKIVLEGFN
ncbi:zinc-binding alcohol dehydrogenase family protein [Dongshaea marina]|uniref:zinc-binding alcohol dehydrogenase family protein n=1 Tax=Dongshaea marina TaxID=2047966 RepID=UPI000D3E5126|nr:zinc-binding alcohol dehydrogenase family protein [Dongshaea marina]